MSEPKFAETCARGGRIRGEWARGLDRGNGRLECAPIRTTIDLPVPRFKEAESAAALRGQLLKEMVALAFRRKLRRAGQSCLREAARRKQLRGAENKAVILGFAVSAGADAAAGTAINFLR